MSIIKGFHHLTACVSGAQEDVDFYVKLLGQSLVKKTVLLDGEDPIYHSTTAMRRAMPERSSRPSPSGRRA